jgi:hypothetical protein
MGRVQQYLVRHDRFFIFLVSDANYNENAGSCSLLRAALERHKYQPTS